MHVRPSHAHRRHALLAIALAAGTVLAHAASITIDYPAQGSIFPPEITPPTFLWLDTNPTVTLWRIDISFAGAAALHTVTSGPRMRVGPIDPLCVAPTNKLPQLTPRQAAYRTWTPDPPMWEAIKRRSVTAPATITLRGFTAASGHPVSRGQVAIRTSTDPVGAPIFYRDVPLMPTMTQTGVIRPVPSEAVRLIDWRLRYIGEPRSRLIMHRVLVCANCHSFSADGKTLGMDLDGLERNKGMYMMLPVQPKTEVTQNNVIQWRSAAGKIDSDLRVGFLSRVSPSGNYVVTTLDPQAGKGSHSNYYVSNFLDYRFLQVFFPTRGILAWYSRSTGILQPLPGADNPAYVQANAVWSPDERYLVFARAEAEDPNPPGAPTAKFANDPNERQIKYSLYRIPFNNGRGGTPEPIAGASNNGMSNAFPKVSPDGRWIVFVECRNGLLMRPDSQLYIVPSSGGRARRLNANLSPMNSWHSFSPNGRWLVFSSKSRSPYTQMYLTHIDENSNDSPAIYIPNTTAANRAVNLPEFVNIPRDGLQSIDGPVLEYYRRFDRALYLQKQGRLDEAIAAWTGVLAVRPGDAPAEENFAAVLLLKGRASEAAAHFRAAREARLRQAIAADPNQAAAHNALGLVLLEEGKSNEAARSFEKAVELKPDFAQARSNLGAALASTGNSAAAIKQFQRAIALDPNSASTYYQLGLAQAGRGATAGAIAQWRKALSIRPQYAQAHDALGDALYARGDAPQALQHWLKAIDLQPGDVVRLREAAWVLATSPSAPLRNGAEAISLATRAANLTGGRDPSVLDTLAAAYAEAGQFDDAVAAERKALALAGHTNAAGPMRARLHLYESKTPYRPPTSPSPGVP